MILLRCLPLAALLPALACAVPAQADVLQISTDGSARWISGPDAQATPVSGNSAVPLAQVPALANTVPEQAVADVAASDAAVPQTWAAAVRRVAARYDLSPALLEAVVWQESRWHPDAVSPAGARGLAQLMPATARAMGVDPDDPRANLEGGARYLREQLDRFHGDLEKALAAYNAGPARVIAADGIPPIAETRSYVAAVLGRLSNTSRSAP